MQYLRVNRLYGGVGLCNLKLTITWNWKQLKDNKNLYYSTVLNAVHITSFKITNTFAKPPFKERQNTLCIRAYLNFALENVLMSSVKISDHLNISHESQFSEFLVLYTPESLVIDVSDP